MSKPYNPTGYDDGNHYGFNAFDIECVAAQIYKQCKADGIKLQPKPLCAILGNMEREGQFHTGIWQNLTVGNENGGYGLTQWTPASTKILAYAKDRGVPSDSLSLQVERLIHYEAVVEPSAQWSQNRSTHGFTFIQFLENKDCDINSLVEDFMYGYENPGDLALQERQNYANGSKFVDGVTIPQIVEKVFGGEIDIDLTVSAPALPDENTEPRSETITDSIYNLLCETSYNLDRLSETQKKQLKTRKLGDKLKVLQFCGSIKNKYGTKVSVRHRWYAIVQVDNKGNLISTRGETIKPHYIDY